MLQFNLQVQGTQDGPLKALRETKVLKFQCRGHKFYEKSFNLLIQAGRGTFHDISTSMLGLCHHQFTYTYTIFIRLVLKCCLAILMILAWHGSTSSYMLTLASHADALCWQFELELVLVVLMLFFMLRVLCFFQRNMEVPPWAQEDPLEILQVVRLICDVRLNIRLDTLQTYSVLENNINNACGLENLDGFCQVGWQRVSKQCLFTDN